MALSRSEQMARIRSTNTRPECALRRALWVRGLRYRLNVRTPFGSPDLTFRSNRVVVFVDGCFWHGCPQHYLRPKTRADYWSEKLRTNVLRDQRQTTGFESQGWRVVRLWEHEIAEDLQSAANKVLRALRGARWRRLPYWRAIRVRPVGPGTLERWDLCTCRPGGKGRSVVKPRVARMWSRAKSRTTSTAEGEAR